MKGYKATYNMKCRNQTYKVGKTYTSDKLKICEHGIHFCEKMDDVIIYYCYNNEFILLEVEAVGTVITEGDKSVTDSIKIIRVVPREEYTFEVPVFEYDDRNNMISKTHPYSGKYIFEYDDRNNMISETYTNGSKYTYEYDDRNNVISITSPNGCKCNFEYTTITESD